MTDHKENAEEIGRAIYESKILPSLQPEDKGKVVVIDIHSGDYEIDRDDITGLVRLLERRPNAFTWAERVGHPAVYYMGAGYGVRIKTASPSDEAKKTEEIGRAIYKSKILPTLQPEDKGKVVVIDIHSGDYEIDREDITALLRLLERRPDAFTWAERVGHPVVYYMGGGYGFRIKGARHD